MLKLFADEASSTLSFSKNRRKKMKVLSRKEAVRKILGSGGKFFTVLVRKRNGELTEMNCRMDVKKHLKGGTKRFDDKVHNLITTYSLDRKGYRSIAVEGLKQVRIDGEIFVVK